jgi:CHAT domain-containing protein/Tfp pilus assembly protein PilF
MKSLPIIVLLCLAISGVAPADGAVVVEAVGRGSALERSGLLPGDVLVTWEATSGSGEIGTVFDWFRVQAEQAPRGSVRLHVRRGDAAAVLDVARGLPWDSHVRPDLDADRLQIYLEGRQRIEAGDVEAGVASWDQLARSAPDLKPWILLETGAAWSKAGRGDKARDALQTALAEEPDAQTRVVLGEALGESYQYANEMARAEAVFRSAVEAGETAWGESLQVSRLMVRLGNVLRLQYRHDEAKQLQRRALEIRQRQAPDSLEVADSLHHLSLILWEQGDLEAMGEHTRRAMAIQERWPNDSLSMADTLNDVSLLEGERGHYAEAVAALQRALAILEQRSPGSIDLATSLARFGAMTRKIGDPESAAELLERALAIRQKLAPESLGIASILTNLGEIARERGELDKAKDLAQRALAIWSKAAPKGNGVVTSLNSLGRIALLQGRLDEAWDLHSRALEISRFDISAFTLGYLGKVAEARGDLNQAMELHQRALAIFERVAPGMIEEALSLQQIARLHRRMGRPDQAAQLLARAVDALESQVGSLGGSQDFQATYRAKHEAIYRDAVEAELERGHAAEAFNLVERSRARSFLTLLAERDLDLSDEVPAALERSRRDNAARYDRTLRELSRWTPEAGDEARESLHLALSRLRREHEEIAARIREASPRVAALRQPQPLDLDAARKVLDPGTLALSYSVGRDRTTLFAVTRDGALRVETLPVGEEALRRDVERFLERVRQPAPLSSQDAGLARSLYRSLIGPVADLVKQSARVLILPDGPLHRLPFGALMRDERFLAEWKPLHTALSLTVYGTLRASKAAGPAQGSSRLAAFGDPRYPRSPVVADAYGPPLRGVNWSPLPNTRREVERIAEIYPGASLYLGEQATEERAKSVGRGVRVLHFATHGYLDDRSPLDSALVLSLPDAGHATGDNGLLQVWEIFDSVRLDADLVVLSACESALGRELSGEGMIGLTRAFQYAGARSVVASLWSVADRATAELMTRFHRHRAAGLSTDEALRAAQIELIRGPVTLATSKGQGMKMDASAPFFWAAFQVFGDWR